MTARDGRIALRAAAVVAIAAAVGAGLLVGCRQRADRPGRRVMLISIDTCRADYLSCYGYSKQTTPTLDALAAEGVLFERAMSPVPQT